MFVPAGLMRCAFFEKQAVDQILFVWCKQKHLAFLQFHAKWWCRRRRPKVHP